jgi:hypothetical protein
MASGEWGSAPGVRSGRRTCGRGSRQWFAKRGYPWAYGHYDGCWRWRPGGMPDGEAAGIAPRASREGPVEASLASRTYRAACRARWKQVRQRVGRRAAVGEAHGAQAEAGCTHPKRRRAAWPLVSWRSAHAARGPRHLLGEQSGRGKAAKFPRAAGALAVGAARPRQATRRGPQSRGPQRAAVRVGVGSRAGARARQWRRKRRRGAGYWRVIRPKITRGPSGVLLRADGCAVTKISKSRYGVRMLICPSWLPFTISWPLFCAGWPAA